MEERLKNALISINNNKEIPPGRIEEARRNAFEIYLAEKRSNKKYEEMEIWEKANILYNLMNDDEKSDDEEEYDEEECDEDLEILRKELNIEIVNNYHYVTDGRKASQGILIGKEDGILLVLNQMQEYKNRKDCVYNGRFYYNWRPNKIEESNKYVSKEFFNGKEFGHFTEDFIWIGNQSLSLLDIFKDIKKLKENGKFIYPWVEIPELWLLDEEEEKDIPLNNKSTYIEEINNKKLKILREKGFKI